MTPKFTCPCFIRMDNAKGRYRLEDRLKDMGRNPVYYYNHEDRVPNVACIKDIYTDNLNLLPDDTIDCGTNEELFLALAALRDDSDYMQWFVSNVKYSASPRHKMIPNSKGVPHIDMETWFDYEWILSTSRNVRVTNLASYHKATPAELIEYFKNE